MMAMINLSDNFIKRTCGRAKEKLFQFDLSDSLTLIDKS